MGQASFLAKEQRSAVEGINHGGHLAAGETGGDHALQISVEPGSAGGVQVVVQIVGDAAPDVFDHLGVVLFKGGGVVPIPRNNKDHDPAVLILIQRGEIRHKAGIVVDIHNWRPQALRNVFRHHRRRDAVGSDGLLQGTERERGDRAGRVVKRNGKADL